MQSSDERRKAKTIFQEQENGPRLGNESQVKMGKQVAR